MKTLTEKEQIIKRLLESKHVTFEEALVLLQTEQKTEWYFNPPIYVPNQIGPIYPSWQPPFTVTC